MEAGQRKDSNQTGRQSAECLREIADKAVDGKRPCPAFGRNDLREDRLIDGVEHAHLRAGGGDRAGKSGKDQQPG